MGSVLLLLTIVLVEVSIGSQILVSSFSLVLNAYSTTPSPTEPRLQKGPLDSWQRTYCGRSAGLMDIALTTTEDTSTRRGSSSMSVVVNNSIRIPVHDDDAIMITKTMISRQEGADVKLLIQYVKLVRKKRQLRNEKVGRILRKFGYEKMLRLVISGFTKQRQILTLQQASRSW